MLAPDEAGGVAPGAVVVPVSVGVVAVEVGLFVVAGVVLVVGATAPAAPVLVEGVVSVSVPLVSEPQPNIASASTAQALTLRREAMRDREPFVWPLSVEFHPKIMSSLQDPPCLSE